MTSVSEQLDVTDTDTTNTINTMAAIVTTSTATDRTTAGHLARVSAVLPDLFISDITAARSPAVLALLGVTHLVDASDAQGGEVPGVARLECRVADSAVVDLAPHLATSHAFLAVARAAGGVVLVHCLCGVSRSPAMVLHHLLRTGATLADAWRLVRDARPVACPNIGFWRILMEVEREERGQVSVGEEEVRRRSRGGGGEARRALDKLDAKNAWCSFL